MPKAETVVKKRSSVLKNPFDLEETFKKAWEGFKKNAVFFIVAVLGSILFSVLLLGITYAIGFLVKFFISLIFTMTAKITYLYDSAFKLFQGGIFFLVLTYFCYVLVKSGLFVNAGKKLDLDVLKPQKAGLVKFFVISFIIIFCSMFLFQLSFLIYKLHLSYSITHVLHAFIVFFVICVILIVSFMLIPSFFIVLDQKAEEASDLKSLIIEPLKAMKTSLSLIKPAIIDFFALVVILIVMNLIGLCACGLGIIITIPLTTIVLANTYKKLEAKFKK